MLHLLNCSQRSSVVPQTVSCSGPSMASTTSATVTVSAARDSRYPPWMPC